MMVISYKGSINGETQSKSDVFWNSGDQMTSFLKSAKLTSHIFSNAENILKWYINDKTFSKYDLFWNSEDQMTSTFEKIDVKYVFEC